MDFVRLKVCRYINMWSTSTLDWLHSCKSNFKTPRWYWGEGTAKCDFWQDRQCLFCTSAVSLLFGATRRVIPELFRKSRHSLLSPSETELSNPAALSSLSPSHLYYQFLLIFRSSQQTLYQFTWLFNCFLYAVMEFFHFVTQAPFPKGTFPGEGC